MNECGYLAVVFGLNPKTTLSIDDTEHIKPVTKRCVTICRDEVNFAQLLYAYESRGLALNSILLLLFSRPQKFVLEQ